MPEEKEEGKNGLPAVRTFKADTSLYIKEKGISLIDAVSSQTKKASLFKAEKEKKEENKIDLKKVFLLISIALVAVFLGFEGYFYFKNKPADEPIQPNLIKPAIKADTETELTIDNVKSIINESLGTGKLMYVAVVTESQGIKKSATARELFDYFGILAPSDLTSDLNENFMFYIFHNSQNWPVFIFTVKSYDRVFAAMLKWENKIIFDFQKIFPVEISAEYINAPFRDKEIKSRDVRVKYTKEEKPAFLYSILNKKYLIVTAEEEALAEIFRRFSSPQYLNN